MKHTIQPGYWRDSDGIWFIILLLGNHVRDTFIIMRIVEVTYTWPAETFIIRHVRALSAKPQIALTIASYSPTKPNSASIQAVGDFAPTVVKLPNFDHMATPEKLRLAAKNAFFARDKDSNIRQKALMKAFTDLMPDVIHFHYGSLAALLSYVPREMGIRYTLSLRGTDIQVNPLVKPEFGDKLSEALTNAAAIHVVCDLFAEQAKQLDVSLPQITTIRTCVPLPAVDLAARPMPEGLHFITVGRLHWRKAYHDLIRAMQYLPDATLDIVGSGPEHAHLTFLIHQLGLQDRVKLHGSLPYDEFQSMLENATAYIQSSVAEGFSNSVAEAMALGKAIFATPAGGTTEIIKDRQNGIIIPMGDAKGIAERLELAKDVDSIMNLGQAARHTAEQTFNETHHADCFHAFFEAAAMS